MLSAGSLTWLGSLVCYQEKVGMRKLGTLTQDAPTTIYTIQSIHSVNSVVGLAHLSVADNISIQ